MQSNPHRAPMRYTQYNRRPARREMDGIWFIIQWCNCCTTNEGRHRSIQKILSKKVTLRTHRTGR